MSKFSATWHEMDKATKLTILVAALGYFVDIFDLLLFSIVRIPSLRDLGYEGADLTSKGILLLNSQMAGLLIGGIFWGIWGDKMGRVSVLFGSILLYSTANIANGFAPNVEIYAALRFIAGIGLAGELGAGVTLASELLPRAWRGIGTTFIASIGVLGATFAGVVADLADWRTAYIIGGCMGLALLILRINVRESGLFAKMEDLKGRGDIRILFKTKERALRYLKVILVGAPLWAVVGLFITFTPEFARAFGMDEANLPTAGKAVLVCYAGLAAGDLLSGLLSQLLKSRKKAVLTFQCLTILFIAIFVLMPHESLFGYYTMCFFLGIGIGYWAMFVQMGAEQFGTNIRATAAVSSPNMVRGMTIPCTMAFHALIPQVGTVSAGVIVVGVVIALSMISALTLKETFDLDLDYTEA